MAQQPDDDPFAIFRSGYNIFAWASLFGTAAILVYLFAVMFVNTASGTASAQRKAEMATRVASSSQPTADPNATAVVQLHATCAACHAIEGTSSSGVTCPDLSDIGSVAEDRIADPGYTGSATTAEEYIRESILEPNAYIVPSADGRVHEAGGVSIMPATTAKDSGLEANPAELERLVAYLLTLK